jgi:hypothetical protein
MRFYTQIRGLGFFTMVQGWKLKSYTLKHTFSLMNHVQVVGSQQDRLKEYLTYKSNLRTTIKKFHIKNGSDDPTYDVKMKTKVINHKIYF